MPSPPAHILIAGAGESLSYDSLLIAVGARQEPAYLAPYLMGREESELLAAAPKGARPLERDRERLSRSN